MKIIGAAPKIAVPTVIYLIITAAIDSYTKPLFTITAKNYSILVFVSIVLIIIGAVMVAITARKLLKSFKAGILMTDGLYSIFRNPMYAAYQLFIIPGVCLLFNSWLVLTTELLNIVLLQLFIKEEYRYLEEKFGKEYQEYLKKVWVKFL